LPDATLRRLDAAGVSELVVTVMVCIDEAGVPTRVNLKSPSHDPEIDALVEARVHELRFEPMVADGKAITPCFAVRLTFVLSP
jgi:outer membrane biosynthesis protein TonB